MVEFELVFERCHLAVSLYGIKCSHNFIGYSLCCGRSYARHVQDWIVDPVRPSLVRVLIPAKAQLILSPLIEALAISTRCMEVERHWIDFIVEYLDIVALYDFSLAMELPPVEAVSVRRGQIDMYRPILQLTVVILRRV